MLVLHGDASSAIARTTADGVPLQIIAQVNAEEDQLAIFAT